jgi:hypothetical protein
LREIEVFEVEIYNRGVLIGADRGARCA